MLFGTKAWEKQERRKYRRVNVLFPVQYAIIPNSLKREKIKLSSLGICRNIGGGGVLLEVSELKEEMLLCNNLVKLEIKLPKEENAFYVFATLAKAERSITQDSYYLHLAFGDIEELDRERIIIFVDRARHKRE